MAYSKGTYNIDVTITQGCTIEFQISSAASSWVHVNPQSGGSGRYVLTIDDGNHGDATVKVYVNGNHCSSRDIAVTSPPVVTCDCGDLTIPETSYTWSATDDSSKKHSFTISSASCITNITKSSLTHFDAIFESGKVTVNPKGANTGQQPYSDILTISYKADSNTCSSAITLTQNAATCQASTCYTVNGDAVNTSTVAYDAQNATVEWDYVETIITPPDCVPVTTTKHASTSVTLTEVATCDDVEETGQFTWAGHKACNGGTSDMTVNWKVTKQKPAGCGCSCSANLSVSGTKNIGYNKQTTASEIGSYTIDSECVGSITVTSVTVTEGSNWLTVTSDNSSPIKATWTENESMTDTRTAVITIKAELNGEPCSSEKTIEVVQAKKNIGCACDDLIVVTSKGEIIDWEKDIILKSADEEYTFTYKFKENKDTCFEGTDVTFSYDSTDAEYFIISTGTTGGKSYINIKPNPNEDPNKIDIHFNYTLSDGTDCSTQWDGNYITIIYNPACKCEELLPDDACIQRQVPTAAGTYPLGTFGVIGCGEFSGKSTSSQVDKVIITESDDGYDVSVKLYEFTPTTSQPDAPIDIDIYSLESGQALADCHHVYRIWQKEDYVNCARVRKINFVDDNPAYTSNVNAYLAKLTDDDGLVAFSALSGSNIITSFSTEHDWIDASTIYVFNITKNTIYLRGKIEANPSAQPRTNTITINYNKDKLRQIYGICEDCINQPFTVTVTQQGDESLNCNCLGLKEIEIRYFGAESSFNSDNLRNDCFVSTGLKFTPIGTIVPGYESAFSDPRAFFTEDNYVAVNNWLSINLDVRSYTTSPEKCYLHVAYKALANTGSERDYAFKIKLNYDTAKQSEECIWEIKFTQEAVIDVTCQQLLDSIKTYSIDVQATKTRDSVAYMRPVLRDDVRLSGVTVQSQGCGDTSWITKIEPGSGNNTDTLYIENTVNKSTERDHSTTSRCAKISVFFIDSEGNRLKINGVQCGEKEITVTQEGYSGDCMACDDAIPKLPIPVFTSYRDTTYESGGKTYPAFYEGDGETDRSLFEIPIPYDYYYDSIEANRCFDLIAKTTHHGSFTPYPDGEYLHVELDESNKKWIIHGMIKPISEPVNTVAVEVYLQRRNLAGGDSTQCENTSYVTNFVILKRQ